MNRDQDLPCLNCRLIEMGEMACCKIKLKLQLRASDVYFDIVIIDQDLCPQCGRAPPGRSNKAMHENRSEKFSLEESGRTQYDREKGQSFQRFFPGQYSDSNV